MQTEKNIVKSAFPSYDIPDISVGKFLLEKISKCIQSNPEQVALIDALSGSTLTYQQLHTQANEIACALLSLPTLDASFSAVCNDLCMFFGDNHPQYVVLLLAMAYLGVPITPSKPANGAYETYQHLNNSGSRILCCSRNKIPIIEQILKDEAHSQYISNLKLLLIIDGDSAVPESIQNHPLAPKQIVTFKQLLAHGNGQSLGRIPHFAVNPASDNHMIVYTSGSTGAPKGAKQTHRSFIASVMAMLHKNAFAQNRNCTISFLFPLGHISGSVFVINCLSSQMSLVMFGQEGRHAAILEAIEKFRVSVAIITLALAADLLQNEELCTRYNLSSLKSIYFSGSRLPEHFSLGLISKLGVRVYEVYGATEFMGSVTNNGPYSPGKIGSPLPNVEMKIIDLSSGEALPMTEPGEVCFRGPNCFAGYLNNDEATGETIDSDGWYHSGDVGFYDQAGNLYITDRIKELCKYKHWTVAPAEVESFLQTHPAIAGVCVVGVKHRSEGQHLRAYVQLAENKSATEEEIVQYVKDNMGYQNRLNGGVRFVDEIPRLPMGKVNRVAFKLEVKNEILVEEAEK